jgi:serine protease
VPMGTGTDESLTVGVDNFEGIAMEGSVDGVGSGPLVDCGLGSSACPGGGGQVCLVERGNITFAEKVLNCQDGGGSAALIYNNQPGLFSGTLGGTVTTIQSVGISGDDGVTLLGRLGETAAVTTLSGGNYDYFDGTSMATPHVSGVAALVWSQDPACTNQEIRDVLASTAEDLGPAGRDNAYGFGLVQAADAAATLSCGGGTGGGGCNLLPKGASCSSNDQCCSNKCKGPSGNKTCK